MRQIRIYTPQPLEKDTEVALDTRAKKHLIQVLRKRTGDTVTLFNGNGQDAHGVIIQADGRAECVVRIDGLDALETESPLPITLIQAIAKGDKMDWLVQKSVELGVAEIQPVWTERTDVRLNEQRALKRQMRWQEIAISACEQSGRAIVPPVRAPMALTALDRLNPGGAFLHPNAAHALTDLDVQSGQPITIAVGPEGGFSNAELERFRAHGMTAMRMGPRVLRTETAGPAALAALQALYGDWR